MSKYKVACLSATFDSHLLWAHYAGAFDGVAIEVELPDDDRNVQRLDYSRGVFGFMQDADSRADDAIAREILFSKYSVWEYEQEIRVLSASQYFELNGAVKRVICGRIDDALMGMLYVLCEREGVELCRIGIGDEGLDADYVNASDIKCLRARSRC